MQPLLTPEQEALKARVGKIGAEILAPLAEKHGEAQGYPPGLVEALRDQGILGLAFTPEYGGTAAVDYESLVLVIVREELSRTCPEADLVFGLQGLGSFPIFLAGTAEQKQRWLPAVARGDALAAFTITEPGAGSDAASLTTSAVLDGDEWVLNGEKTFISNAGVAGIYTVFARTSPDAVSCFVVEAGTPGLRTQRIELMVPHVIGSVFFENCRIPKENLLGRVGQGMRICFGTLDVFRATVGAQSLGLAQAAMDFAISRAKERQQFGRPISKFQLIQAKLAEMAMEVKAGRMLVYHAAWLRDNTGDPATMDSSIAKAYATEMAVRVVDQAVQIYGGYGLRKDYPVERLYREVRAPAIYEGTSEIQRLVIARHLLHDKG